MMGHHSMIALHYIDSILPAFHSLPHTGFEEASCHDRNEPLEGVTCHGASGGSRSLMWSPAKASKELGSHCYSNKETGCTCDLSELESGPIRHIKCSLVE